MQNEVARARAARECATEIRRQERVERDHMDIDDMTAIIAEFMRAYIAPLEQRWIPVSDLPEEGQRVILKIQGWGCVQSATFLNGEFDWSPYTDRDLDERKSDEPEPIVIGWIPEPALTPDAPSASAILQDSAEHAAKDYKAKELAEFERMNAQGNRIAVPLKPRIIGEPGEHLKKVTRAEPDKEKP